MSGIESNVFFVRAKAILKSCPECGNPVALSDIAETVECSSCGSSFGVEGKMWEEALGLLHNPTLLVSATEKASQGKTVPPSHRTVKGTRFSLEIDHECTAPQCTACGKPIELPASAPGGQLFEVRCASCGSRNVYSPPAPWLAAVSPSLTHVGRAQAEAAASAGAAPVVMTCPNCRANLTLTPDSKRLTRCEYCGASVHLPEEIWKEFHPARKASALILRIVPGPEAFRSAAKAGCVIGVLGVGWSAIGAGMGYGGLSMILSQRQSEGWVGGIIMMCVGTLLFVIPGALMVFSTLDDYVKFRKLAARFEKA